MGKLVIFETDNERIIIRDIPDKMTDKAVFKMLSEEYDGVIPLYRRTSTIEIAHDDLRVSMRFGAKGQSL